MGAWLAGKLLLLSRLVYSLYNRMKLVHYGSGCSFPGPIHITSPRSVFLGNDVFINPGVSLISDNAYPIVIKDRALLSAGCCISSIGLRVKRGRITREHEGAKVVIGENVWVGARAVVLPGTMIGENTIVAAGAVVRGRLLPNAVYAGVPGKLVKRLKK